MLILAYTHFPDPPLTQDEDGNIMQIKQQTNTTPQELIEHLNIWVCVNLNISTVSLRRRKTDVKLSLPLQGCF